MCWSGEASAVLAVAGFAGSAYYFRKGEAKPLCAALAYFSCMEALQAYTYSVIDECSRPANQIATLLGYLHIAFQPFFINAVSLHFIPGHIRTRIQSGVYALCLVAAWLYIMRLYPFSWATPCYDMRYSVPFCSTCQPRIPFCGKEICSIHGDWHIAWQLPARFVYVFDNAYLVAGFIIPVLYGSWRMTLYHIVSGPLLALLTTSNANEWAAVWCLYSIGLLGLIMKSRLRNLLNVQRWFWWRWISAAHHENTIP